MSDSSTSVVVTGGAALTLAVASIGASVVVGWTWSEYVNSYALTNVVVGLALALCGVMIGWFRPRNRVGIIFMVAGLGHLVSGALAPLGALAVEANWPEPITRLVAAVFLAAWTLGLPSLFFLALLLFPDGRLPSPAWRPVAWLIIGVMLFGVVTAVMTPNGPTPGEPGAVSLFAWPGAPFPVFDAVNSIAAFAMLVLVVASLTFRYVRGEEQTRRQLLWLILAVVAMLLLNLQRWVTGDGPILLLLSTVFLPIAVAIGIVKYRLLDIRVVLSRTLLYGLLIAVVIALYAGMVAVLTLVIPAEADRAVAILVAVAVALAFNPLRLLLQRAIARTFYGVRADPSATAQSVSETLDAAADLAGVLAALRNSLRLPRVAVVAPDGLELAEDGSDADSPRIALSLPSGGEACSVLVVSLRPGERSLHEADRRALALVTPLLGMVLRERALVDDLRDARAQTVESRERERQVLHRDLHDGLGPTLTSAALRIDAAGNVIGSDPGRARTVLADARADVGSALTEVRRVVYGLRPIPLDEHGLIGALREHAEHPAALDVEVTSETALPELSPAVELAAYRVALEGIANANRHSSGSKVTVDVAADADVLEVTVRDDGDPPSHYRTGVGIRSLTARVEELGGTVAVGPAPCGWEVEARLPLRATGG